MKQKINRHLIYIALIAIIFTALGITFIHYNLFKDQVRNDLKLHATILKDTNAFQKGDNKNGQNKYVDKTVLDHISDGQLRITRVAANGIVLFDNSATLDKLDNHLNRPEIKDALAKGEGESVRRSDTLNLDSFYYAVLLEDGTVLRVSVKARNIISVFLSSLPVIVAIVAFVLLICVLISNYITRQLLKPVEHMVENLDKLNSITVYSELQPLADKIRSQHEHILMAAKSRQDFTANISHELKTPITAISGYAELIENKLVSSDDEIHIAKEIRHSATRLLLLITDIIQLSELDHAELPRKFEQVDLYQVAKECIKDIEQVAVHNTIALSLSGCSAIANADKRLIREMLDNLVHNAIQYNRPKGFVNVSVGTENNHPRIIVEDNGIGIPADQQERVFERFYRVEKSRSRETGGTGLGLAIVKHIVEIHDAKISLKSVLGEGTKISVLF